MWVWSQRRMTGTTNLDRHRAVREESIISRRTSLSSVPGGLVGRGEEGRGERGREEEKEGESNRGGGEGWEGEERKGLDCVVQ